MEALHSLLTTLKDGDAQERVHAAAALGRLADSRAAEPLCDALRDPRRAVRGAVASALLQVGPPTIAPLCRALRDVDRRLAEGAARVLAAIGPAAVRPLCQALADENPRVRRRAAAILRELRDARALSALHTALRDEDHSVRARAADALGRIGRRDSLAALRTRLLPWVGETEPLVRRVIREAIREITQTAGADLPVPASAPPLAAASLPRPAQPPSGAPDSLVNSASEAQKAHKGRHARKY
ncbi:MAG TPA: HEAT repeat domain-containing protein [Armatimonadota bacterium]|nr:HEAT repeat domain-containing protein [Armatimonadota bacterium]